ncbi:hypothetical protein [Paenibacillus melissococcoides]|uniref:hypothetical protein n=1 Tax=Paenibacillus melissococcoides TaxID=2912268 RepID=UPI0029056802|nr:hypothetical protein [Paenibacillus melissococcoides]
MNATTITIHNTGNSGSSAKNERGWLTNPDNDRTASYHIVVDEHEAIECIPLVRMHGMLVMAATLQAAIVHLSQLKYANLELSATLRNAA